MFEEEEEIISYSKNETNKKTPKQKKTKTTQDEGK